MITIIEGKPGQGKTVFGTDQILRALENKKTYVASNIEIDTKLLKRHSFRFEQLSLDNTIQDILNIDTKKVYEEFGCNRILIVIDEVQTIMNSREWDKMPPEFQFFLQQHRHFRMDIIGLTQSIRRADVVMRELVQYFYRIYKVAVIKIPFVGVVGDRKSVV